MYTINLSVWDFICSKTSPLPFYLLKVIKKQLTFKMAREVFYSKEIKSAGGSLKVSPTRALKNVLNELGLTNPMSKQVLILAGES